MTFEIRPLTPDLWPAFVDVVGPNGACGGCFCMYWRIGTRYQRRSRAANRADFHRVVKRGPPPGLIAFEGDTPVGWCQLTPRTDLPHFERTRDLKKVDDLPVWSISCFYIRPGWRRKGVTAALIAEALRVAKRAKAVAVEAYPLDTRYTSSRGYTGYASTFERLGFSTVLRRVDARPIMRHDLRSLRRGR